MTFASVAGHREPVKRKFRYSGDMTQLAPGYVFCFDHAAPVNNTRDGRFAAVTKPVTANLNLFAGVLAEKPAPNDQYVTLYVPKRGDVCPALVLANATVGTTALTPVNNQWYFGVHTDATLNLPMVAVAGETADTSGAAANKLVYML